MSLSSVLRKAIHFNSQLLTSYIYELFSTSSHPCSARILACYISKLYSMSSYPLQFPAPNQPFMSSFPREAIHCKPQLLFMSSFLRQAIHFDSQLLASYSRALFYVSRPFSARLLSSYISEFYSMSSHPLQFPVLTSYSWALRQAVPCNSPIFTSYSWALFYVKPSLLSSALSQLLISFFLRKAILAQLLAGHLWALFYSNQPLQFPTTNQLFMSFFLRNAILAQLLAGHLWAFFYSNQPLQFQLLTSYIHELLFA